MNHFTNLKFYNYLLYNFSSSTIHRKNFFLILVIITYTILLTLIKSCNNIATQFLLHKNVKLLSSIMKCNNFHTKSSDVILAILNNFTKILFHNFLWKMLPTLLIHFFLRDIVTTILPLRLKFEIY